MSINASAARTFVEKTLERYMGQDVWSRLEAEAVDEVICKLREAPNSAWNRICCETAHDLAEHSCALTKQSDLKLITGGSSWNIQNGHIADALRIMGLNRRRRRQILNAARTEFVRTIERIQDRRLGCPEARNARRRAVRLDEFFQAMLKDGCGCGASLEAGGIAHIDSNGFTAASSGRPLPRT